MEKEDLRTKVVLAIFIFSVIHLSLGILLSSRDIYAIQQYISPTTLYLRGLSSVTLIALASSLAPMTGLFLIGRKIRPIKRTNVALISSFISIAIFSWVATTHDKSYRPGNLIIKNHDMFGPIGEYLMFLIVLVVLTIIVYQTYDQPRSKAALIIVAAVITTILILLSLSNIYVQSNKLHESQIDYNCRVLFGLILIKESDSEYSDIERGKYRAWSEENINRELNILKEEFGDICKSQIEIRLDDFERFISYNGKSKYLEESDKKIITMWFQEQ